MELLKPAQLYRLVLVTQRVEIIAKCPKKQYLKTFSLFHWPPLQLCCIKVRQNHYLQSQIPLGRIQHLLLTCYHFQQQWSYLIAHSFWLLAFPKLKNNCSYCTSTKSKGITLWKGEVKYMFIFSSPVLVTPTFPHISPHEFTIYYLP